jgi:hypothetical protein
MKMENKNRKGVYIGNNNRTIQKFIGCKK